MDTAKIKSFFVNHVEKIILAGVVGTSLFLIVKGFGIEHFTDKNDPSSLTDHARQVKLEIDSDRTAAIVTPRVPTLDIVKKTEEIKEPVDPTAYKLVHPWTVPGAGTIVPRQDPQIAAPRALLMRTFVGSIALQNPKSRDRDDYPLFRAPGADALESEKPKRGKPKPAGLSRLGDDDERSFLDEDPGRRGSEQEVDLRGAGRKFNAKFDYGALARTVNERPPVPKLARFIAGVAVVPHKEIFDAYKLALHDADSYSPSRDIPSYVNFEVHRADVSNKSVAQLVDEDWSFIWNRRFYENIAERHWAGTAPDIVPPEYRDHNLSNWIPPVLLDDYRSFVTHPLIPMTSPNELEIEDEELDDRPGSDSLFSDEDTRTANTGIARRRSGVGMGGMGDMGSDGRRSQNNSRIGRSSNQEEEQEPVDYKLIRFYDFHDVGQKNKKPKPGATYVYRIRFAVEDPNFPLDDNNAPSLRSLAPEVEQRVLPLTNKFTKTRDRDYQRWSPWSEPSEPVSLPSLNQQFAGPVKPGNFYDWNVAGKSVRYYRGQPTGKVVTSQFSERYGARLPFLMDVGEGSVLSHQGDADVVDPLTLEIKKLADAKVQSSTTVVDMTGGAPLGLIEGLNQPGMMLLTDEYGKLIVAGEVDDLESFRIYSYADEREK